MDISPTAYEELRLELNQTKRRVDELERQVSLLEDCAELDKKPAPQPDGFEDWAGNGGIITVPRWNGPPFDVKVDPRVGEIIWSAAKQSLKSKHDEELFRAFMTGWVRGASKGDWETGVEAEVQARQLLAAGTLGKP